MRWSLIDLRYGVQSCSRGLNIIELYCIIVPGSPRYLEAAMPNISVREIRYTQIH